MSPGEVFAVDYRLGGDFGKLNYFSVGSGLTALTEDSISKRTRVDTPGLNIGYINRSPHSKFGSFSIFGGNILFKPGDNPQILTLTFGMML